MEPTWLRNNAFVEWKQPWMAALASRGYPVKRFTALHFGLGASSYRVLLSDGRSVRLRYCFVEEEPFWGEDIGHLFFPNASWVLRRLEALPEHGLAIYPWYGGKTLQAIGIKGDVEALSRGFESCGRVLGQMATVKLGDAGLFDQSGKVAKKWSSVWAGYLGFWEETLRSPHLNGRIETSVLQKLNTGLSGATQSMQGVMAVPVLTHGDFKPSNLVLCRGRVRVVLDWDFAHSGSWLMSAGQLLRFAGEFRFQAERDIASGLSDALRLPPGWAQLARWVDVLSLVNLLSRPLASDRQITNIGMLLRDTLDSGSIA